MSLSLSTRCARRWDRAPNDRMEHGAGLRNSMDDFVAGSDLDTAVSSRRTAGTPSMLVCLQRLAGDVSTSWKRPE